MKKSDQERMIRNRFKRDMYDDEDCPETTPESATKFRRVNPIRRKGKLMQRQEHQVNQGIEGIYRNDEDERNQAFQRLESMRRKVDNLDYEAELAAYREEYLL